MPAKLHLWLIRFIGLIVPRRLRADWRQEWEAELRWREQQLAQWDKLSWHNKVDLWRRSFGAFVDALLLQPRRLEDEMFQDLRFGARMLLKHKGFTLVAVLSLALGIGANTAIFSVIYAVLWRPLPYQQPEQLVMVWARSKHEKQTMTSPNPPALFLEWRKNKEVFADVAAYEDAAIAHRPRFFLTGNGEPERIAGAYVSGNLFSLLGVQPIFGRTLTIEDEQPGQEPVVLLSSGFWRRRFDADPNVLGKPLRLNNRLFTIIGVMPPDFKLSYPQATELWTPLTFGAEERANWDEVAYKVVARLRPSVSLQQTRDAATRLTQSLLASRWKSSPLPEELYAQLDPLHEYHFGQMRTPLNLLLAAVTAMLLIACVNIAGLSLARTTERNREIAVRAALGAHRRRLIRQLLTENLLPAILGGALGLVLAFWGCRLLVALMPETVPRSGDVKINAVILAFTALLSITAGVLSGLLPALQASKPDLNESLKAGARQATAQGRTQRRRDLLIITEVALSLTLLIAAGLMVRSLWLLNHVELGFNPQNVLTLHFTIPFYNPETDKARRKALVQARLKTVIEGAVERIKSLPGVTSAAAANSVPQRNVDYFSAFDIAGKPNKQYTARERAVSSDYFRTMGIRLLKGRAFTDRDALNSDKVAIVTEEFVKRYFPNEDVLGQRLDPSDWNAEVIGVVADVRHKRPDQPPEPALYLPLSQHLANVVCLVIRSESNPLQLTTAVRQAVWTVDKDLPLEEIATMEQITAAATSDSRFVSLVLGAFALTALLLSATGIYGTISYTVTRRTHEIGIRMALGAQARDVLALVIRQGLKLIVIGAALGLAGALTFTRILKNLLFGVTPTEPLTFAGVTALLTAVALLACYLPARRATKIDPLVALRHE